MAINTKTEMPKEFEVTSESLERSQIRLKEREASQDDPWSSKNQERFAVDVMSK